MSSYNAAHYVLPAVAWGAVAGCIPSPNSPLGTSSKTPVSPTAAEATLHPGSDRVTSVTAEPEGQVSPQQSEAEPVDMRFDGVDRQVSVPQSVQSDPTVLLADVEPVQDSDAAPPRLAEDVTRQDHPSALAAVPQPVLPVEPQEEGPTLPSGSNLIPRELLLATPLRARARVSPDGRLLAFLARSDGAMNIFVAPVDRLEEARRVTLNADQDVGDYFWSYTSRHLLFSSDRSEGGQRHVFAVNLDTRQIKDLTPLANISARVMAVSDAFPAEILIGLNDRPPHDLYDVYRVNMITGERQRVLRNSGFADFDFDADYKVRLAKTVAPDGGQRYLTPDVDAPTGWKELLRLKPQDALMSGPLGFARGAREVYFLDSRDRNTGAVHLLDLATGQSQLMAENDLAEVSGVMLHPTEKYLQAVTFSYDRRTWKVLDPDLDSDLEFLHSEARGEVRIDSRTLNDSLWTVVFEADDRPPQYYLYRRQPRSLKFLFSAHPALDDLPLAKMNPVEITSRDGLTLVSYLSLPVGSDEDQDQRPDVPLPMVMLVHGGPWAREDWGFRPVHQLLANRGYAVLSVNYRGSSGLGKRLLSAGDLEWAGKMHDDLVDAVGWAIGQGVAASDRVAIMGGGYGGYATLVGLTFSPDAFACGVDVSGPANLVSWLDRPPSDGSLCRPLLASRVGDHRTIDGREFLLSRSPARFADRIKRPLLVTQGAQDESVPQAEIDRLVATVARNRVPVTYLVFPNESHRFQSPANRVAFYAIAESFLARHLGGRCEPLGDVLQRAVLEVPQGKEQVRGLESALGAQMPQ